jgi:hypothetical protein
VRPVAVLWRTGPGKALVAALVLASFLVHAPAVYRRAADWDNAADVDNHPEKLWSWSHPPFLYPWQHSPTAKAKLLVHKSHRSPLLHTPP